MRWVENGPDIPFEVIRARQEGRLVFFCGAGVSQQAGLPCFKGLVDAVYAKLHRELELHPLENEAFEHKNYDQVLTILEQSQTNPKLVREKVVEALQVPDDADTETHKALIALGTDSDNVCRLVTTNYDLCFKRHSDALVRIHAAPRLPIPKPGRWNSIVHLHGLVDDCGPNLEELVLTSADFGAAYLVDGWATKFLLGLFQHFTVLFVGYSADDLVIRYMLQALAVSLAVENGRPRVFAFAETVDDEQSTILRWQAKGIKPILYTNKDSDHRKLHGSLRAWADRASRGLMGRQSVLDDCMKFQPPVGPEIVDQALWALSDDDGVTAKALAEKQPSPSPQHWLEILDQGGLFTLNGVPLVSDGRAPYRAEVMHDVTWNLAKWLCEHLEEHLLLDWVLKKGGHLDPRFRRLIRDALEKKQGAISHEMEKAWRYLSQTFRPAPPVWLAESHHLREQIAAGRWDSQLRLEIACLLEPVPSLRRDTFKDLLREKLATESDEYPIEVDVGLAGGDELQFVLDSIRESGNADVIRTSLLDDCTTALRRVMEVLHYFDEITHDYDSTAIFMESIDHTGGRHPVKPWLGLVDLAAECLLSAIRINPAIAQAQVERWKTINYPVFRRLVCFAYSREGLYANDQALAFLLNDPVVFWEHACFSEIRCILVRLAPKLDEESFERLSRRLLDGPPPGHYRADLSNEEVQRVSDAAIERRILAFRGATSSLPSSLEEFLSALSKKYPEQEVDKSVQEIFWENLTPQEIASLMGDDLQNDEQLGQWRSISSSHPQLATDALALLSATGKWPEKAWCVSLEIMGVRAHQRTLTLPEAERVLKVADQAPDNFIRGIVNPVTYLLSALPTMPGFDQVQAYWKVWDRTVSVTSCQQDGNNGDEVTLGDAISTTRGRLAQALFEWMRERASSGQYTVPESFWHKLAILCDDLSPDRRPRLLAAMHLRWIFSNNAGWTEKYLLPYFDWSRPKEAAAVWEGCLCSPNLRPEIWPTLQQHFVATFDNVGALSREAVRNLYQQFAHIVVHFSEWLTYTECQRITTNASHEGREQIAWMFWRDLDNAGDRAEVLWRERIGPWIERCWQADRELTHPATCKNLVRMAVASRGAYPDAVKTIENRVMPLARPDDAIYSIKKAEMQSRFPADTLRLLYLIVDRGQKLYKGDLAKLLYEIKEHWDGAEEDGQFQALRDFAGA